MERRGAIARPFSFRRAVVSRRRGARRGDRPPGRFRRAPAIRSRAAAQPDLSRQEAPLSHAKPFARGSTYIHARGALLVRSRARARAELSRWPCKSAMRLVEPRVARFFFVYFVRKTTRRTLDACNASGGAGACRWTAGRPMTPEGSGVADEANDCSGRCREAQCSGPRRRSSKRGVHGSGRRKRGGGTREDRSHVAGRRRQRLPTAKDRRLLARSNAQRAQRDGAHPRRAPHQPLRKPESGSRGRRGGVSAQAGIRSRIRRVRRAARRARRESTNGGRGRRIRTLFGINEGHPGRRPPANVRGAERKRRPPARTRITGRRDFLPGGPRRGRQARPTERRASRLRPLRLERRDVRHRVQAGLEGRRPRSLDRNHRHGGNAPRRRMGGHLRTAAAADDDSRRQ